MYHVFGRSNYGNMLVALFLGTLGCGGAETRPWKPSTLNPNPARRPNPDRAVEGVQFRIHATVIMTVSEGA